MLIKEIILERNPYAIFLEDEFDEALLGSGIPCGQKYVAVYDTDKCINIIMKTLNMNEVEAYEQFQLTAELANPSPNKPILFSNFMEIKEPLLKDVDPNSTI